MPPAVERRLPQRQAKTLFLRVPNGDWQAVTRGTIEEFRAALGNVPQLWRVPLPSLAICYRKTGAGWDHRVMTLLDTREEMLGAIDEGGLRRAGYTGDRAYDRFVRDWTIREKRRFEPRRKVRVFRVRPFEGTYAELEQVGFALVEHLYGDVLERAMLDRMRQELVG